jgi:hypothetical protein
MMLRTPPQRKRRAEADADLDLDLDPDLAAAVAVATGRTPVSDRRLVLYDRPAGLVAASGTGEPSDDMVCTYHCRQMVRSRRPYLQLFMVLLCISIYPTQYVLLPLTGMLCQILLYSSQIGLTCYYNLS